MKLLWTMLLKNESSNLCVIMLRLKFLELVFDHAINHWYSQQPSNLDLNIHLNSLELLTLLVCHIKENPIKKHINYNVKHMFWYTWADIIKSSLTDVYSSDWVVTCNIKKCSKVIMFIVFFFYFFVHHNSWTVFKCVWVILVFYDFQIFHLNHRQKSHLSTSS